MLSWVLLSTSYSVSNAQGVGALDPTQVYNTPNLVVPTQQGGPSSWTNGVYQDSLSCWAWGLIGYCGPNPIVRPDGNINYSFGWVDLYQQQAVASVLPNSGTGLRVNGYNFGFTAKKGNGWDDGRTDLLYAYVQFNSPTGSTLFNNTTNLSYNFDWTNFNLSYNFATPYATKDLGTVRYGFVGQDNNYWAGPYGPEINNVSFSLKYSVDTCFVNVLSSPSCPGYLEELAKLNPPVINNITTVESSPTTTTNITNDPVSPIVVTYSATASSSTSLQAPTITATSTQTTTSERSISTPSISTILGIIRAEQSRISSVEGAVVSQANETAAQAASQAQKQAESVASLSVLSSQVNQTTQNQNNNQGTGISGPSQVTSIVNIGSLRAPDSLSSSSENYSLVPSQTSNSIINITSLMSRNLENNRSVEVDVPKLASIDFFSRSPIKDILDEKPKGQTEQPQTQQRQSEVKRNVQDNEAAGGVTIAAIAKQSSGYDLYMAMAIKDASFYAPREIYKNQKVIDNERVLRQLNGRSDRIHEEMVNGQYK